MPLEKTLIRASSVKRDRCGNELADQQADEAVRLAGNPTQVWEWTDCQRKAYAAAIARVLHMMVDVRMLLTRLNADPLLKAKRIAIVKRSICGPLLASGRLS